MLITDEIYRWQGFGDGFRTWQSHCRLRIFQFHPESIVIVVSDQGNDTGTSITNCAGQLATRAVKEFHLNPELLTWIEHYPNSDVEFSRVEFDWSGMVASNPQWAYLTTGQVQTITQHNLID